MTSQSYNWNLLRSRINPVSHSKEPIWNLAAMQHLRNLSLSPYTMETMQVQTQCFSRESFLDEVIFHVFRVLGVLYFLGCHKNALPSRGLVSNSSRRIWFNYIIASVLPKKHNASIKAPMLVVQYIGRLEQTVLIHFGAFFSTLFSPPCNLNKLLKGIPN